jgi:N utilization substance protein A
MANRALSPARISRVGVLDPVERHLEVVVDDTQLSLAIGKKGQNVRLAAKLIGWRIDIKSEEQKRQEVETAMAAFTGSGTPVSVLVDHGLTDEVVDRLLEAEAKTVESLADMTPEQLEAIKGIDAESLGAIQMAVNSYYAQFEQAQSGPDLTDPSVVFGPLPTDSEGAESKGGAAAKPKVGAGAFMPGLPVEGAEESDDSDDDFDEEEVEFEDEEFEDEDTDEDSDNMERDEDALRKGVSSIQASIEVPGEEQVESTPAASAEDAAGEDEDRSDERMNPEG